MKNIAKLSLLVVFCMFVSEAMDSDLGVVRFTRNDISDNVISRDYSANLKALQEQSIALFGGNQLPSIVASDCHFKNLLQKVEQEVEQDQTIAKKDKQAVKAKKKAEEFQRICDFVYKKKKNGTTRQNNLIC